MFTPFTEPMHIHYLNGQLRDATIIDKVGDNKYIAEYEGGNEAPVHHRHHR